MNLLTIVFDDIQTATTAWGDLDVPKVKRERVDVIVIALFDNMVHCRRIVCNLLVISYYT